MQIRTGRAKCLKTQFSFGKQSLRRFRSWSLQDALGAKSDAPPNAPSVDSTQEPTLSTIAGSGGGKLSQSENLRPRNRSRTSTASPRSGSPSATPVLSNRKRSLPPAPPAGHPGGDYHLDGDIAGGCGSSLIFGYLHKLGRNGHWQRRFFESDGSSLTYYKSGKMNKVLATLDLCKVRGGNGPIRPPFFVPPS